MFSCCRNDESLGYIEVFYIKLIIEKIETKVKKKELQVQCKTSSAKCFKPVSHNIKSSTHKKSKIFSINNITKE